MTMNQKPTIKHTIPCPECKGSGVEEHEEVSDSGVYAVSFEDCSNCEGTGRILPLEDPDEYGDWLLHKMRDEE